MRNLIHNLDKLPFVDRELYYKKYPYLAKLPVKKFLTMRGCPHKCTFCYNSTLMKMTKDKGQYLRQRSPDNVLEEIRLDR